MHMQPAAGFGGYLTYHPRFTLPEHRMLELRDVLVERTHVNEPENPSIPIDWFCNNADGPPYHTREGVLLYRDGGDSEEPAVLFFRSGGNPLRMPPSVHVPDPSEQAALADAAGDLWTSAEATARGFDVLTRYLVSLLDDSTRWTPVQFADLYAD